MERARAELDRRGKGYQMDADKWSGETARLQSELVEVRDSRVAAEARAHELELELELRQADVGKSAATIQRQLGEIERLHIEVSKIDHKMWVIIMCKLIKLYRVFTPNSF